jgi:hypothetical protein
VSICHLSFLLFLSAVLYLIRQVVFLKGFNERSMCLLLEIKL